LIKFADEATIIVSSGKGGDGCVAFRREKYVPLGGPAGGDGGRGGDVVFEVRRNLRTLADLRYKQCFRAENGQPGMGRNMNGRNGNDVIIPIPPGTILRNAESGEILKDFGRAKDGERWCFLKGGRGGWGNTHFKSSVNQAPRQFQPGQSGVEVRLKVELRMIADVGLVGLPNAGKSSLLDSYTNARPKIAPYPFTTKIPNLGMLHVHDRDIVIADIPGIIEGAHEGAGLGVRFLKHIARTSVLAFLIDLSDDRWRETFGVLLKELEAFSPELVSRKRVIVATKLDLDEAAERFDEFAAFFPDEEVYGISVFSKVGLDQLREALFRMVTEAEREAESAAIDEDDEDLFGLEDEDDDSGGIKLPGDGL
jgi:GTP-binding protein